MAGQRAISRKLDSPTLKLDPQLRVTTFGPKSASVQLRFWDRVLRLPAKPQFDRSSLPVAPFSVERVYMFQELPK